MKICFIIQISPLKVNNLYKTQSMIFKLLTDKVQKIERDTSEGQDSSKEGGGEICAEFSTKQGKL